MTPENVPTLSRRRLLVGAAATSAALTIPATRPAHADAATVPPPIVWAIGDTIDGANQTFLANTPGVGAITQWYNGPDDITDYLYAQYAPGGSNRQQLEALWADGRGVQLVIYPQSGTDSRPAGDGQDSTTTTTPGMELNAYCLTQQCVTDIANLVSWFSAPNNPCFVVLFTEFQNGTYGYPPGYSGEQWEADLMAQVPKIVAACHAVNPDSKIGLGLAGYDETGSVPALTRATPDPSGLDPASHPQAGDGAGTSAQERQTDSSGAFGSYTTAIEGCDLVWCQDLFSCISVQPSGTTDFVDAAHNFSKQVAASGIRVGGKPIPWGLSHCGVYAGAGQASSAVAIAQAPAGTVQQLELTTTPGDAFPPVPFYATLYPDNSDTALARTERVKVTAITGDTWTLTRGDNSYTASYPPGAQLVHCLNPAYLGSNAVDQHYNANPAGRIAHIETALLCNPTALTNLGLCWVGLMTGTVSGPSGQQAGACWYRPGAQQTALSAWINQTGVTAATLTASMGAATAKCAA